MNTQDSHMIERLEKLAKSLYINGFDHVYIYRRLHRISSDSTLSNQIIGALHQDREVQEARAQHISQLGQTVSTGEHYFSLTIGVMLITFGFLIQSFVSMAGYASGLPIFIMILGLLIALRHYIR